MEWKQLMERPNRNSSLGDAVRLHCQGKSTTRLKANLERLFDTLSGDELVDQVIKRVYIYAVKESDKIMDSDSRDVASFNEIEVIKQIIREMLKEYVSSFILDEHREFIVRCHARGLSTSDAVMELIQTDNVINQLAGESAIGEKSLQEMLIRRLAYLLSAGEKLDKQPVVL